jgi:hypothetical protein
LNYGWSAMEGRECFANSSCSAVGLTPPNFTYQHANGTCAITGGYVYRGTRVPQLTGHYVYSDYCTGAVRSFRLSAGTIVELRDWTATVSPGTHIVSFGEDARGDVYMMTLLGGLFRIVAAP